MACFRATAKTWMFFLGLIFWAVAGGLFYLGGFIFYSHGHLDQIAASKFVLLPGTWQMSIPSCVTRLITHSSLSIARIVRSSVCPTVTTDQVTKWKLKARTWLVHF